MSSRKHPSDPLPKTHAMAKTSTLAGQAQDGRFGGDRVKQDANGEYLQAGKHSIRFPNFNSF